MFFLRFSTSKCSHAVISCRFLRVRSRSRKTLNNFLQTAAQTTHGRKHGFILNLAVNTYSRGIHTTRRLDALPFGALLVKLASPFLRILALVGGRMFRRLWRKLPGHHQAAIKQKVFHREDLLVLIPGFLVIGCGVFYYINHEETPVTGRPRLMAINHSQMKEISELGWRETLEQYAEEILPVSHPDHQRVHRVVKNLVLSNDIKEMEHLNWELFTVESELVNAFVFPNGQIFMFTGMLHSLPNDDSLAYILGHEMSHAILQHAAEQASLHGFGNLVYMVVLATISALVPDISTSLFANWLQSKIFDILVHLPYSRMLETEADQVGINIAAKACYDVREAPKVWKRLEQKQILEEEGEPTEWLSTHPSHGNRAKALENLVPEALELRKKCNCPELPVIPPLVSRGSYRQRHLWPPSLTHQAKEVC